MVRSMGWLRAVLVFYLSVELLVRAWAAALVLSLDPPIVCGGMRAPG
jgi:hypothetical protein